MMNKIMLDKLITGWVEQRNPAISAGVAGIRSALSQPTRADTRWGRPPVPRDTAFAQRKAAGSCRYVAVAVGPVRNAG